jgi:hypothetical protein
MNLNKTIYNKYCLLCNFNYNYKNTDFCQECITTLDMKDEEINNLNKRDKFLIFKRGKYKIKPNSNLNKNIISKRRKNIRKILLNSKLKLNKLEYKKNTVCDTFIKYGKPDIDTVIEILENENRNTTDNLITLINVLDDINEEYNPDVPAYKTYIKTGHNLNNVIKVGRIEKIIMKETNYLKYLKEYSQTDALDIASIEYMEILRESNIKKSKEYSIISKYIDSITTVNF